MRKIYTLMFHTMQKVIPCILVFLLIVNKLHAQNAKIDSLKLVLKTTKDTSRVNTLNRLAKAYHFIDSKQLLAYSLKAKALSTELGYRDGLAKALCNIGVYYSTTQEYEKSRFFLNQSLKIVSPTDYYLITILYHNLAHKENNLPLQLKYLKKAIKSAKRINFKQIGFLYHTLGNFYYNQSKYRESFSYFMDGLEAAERLKDSISISLNLDGISHVLSSQDDERSFSFNIKALKIAEQLQSKPVIVSIKSNLANYYKKKRELDTAFTLVSQALELAKQIDYKDRIGNNYSLLGDILHLQNKNTAAIESYTNALRSISRKDKYWDISNALLGLGSVYNSMGRYDKAIPHLNRALKLAKHPDTRDLLWEIYFELSQAYKKSSDYKKAYHYYELYHLVKDSLYNLESKKQIISIQAKYEMNKKEQSIKLLRKNNRIKDLKISQSQSRFILVIGLCFFILLITFLVYNKYRIKVRANKHMEKANLEILNNVKEKEVLLQEIHHRVKNNLQLISSLLKWQGESLENEQMLKIIGDGRSRIKSMALIHEALYQSNNLIYLNLQHYLIDLLSYLDKAYNKNKKIVLEQNIQPLSLDVDVAIPLGLIVTELIANSFKYAFPLREEGRIYISLSEESPKIYTLKMGDNGIGFPEDIFYDSESKTMGIHLVKLLVKQIKGTINICNENGANFIISFGDIHYKSAQIIRKEFQTAN